MRWAGPKDTREGPIPSAPTGLMHPIFGKNGVHQLGHRRVSANMSRDGSSVGNDLMEG
jgi:hypothetical protein